MLASPPNRLLTALEDMVKNIQIESQFCIRHPNYQPFTLPKAVTARLEQTPEAVTDQYLSLLLRNFLYGIYCNGSLQTTSPLANSTNLAPHQNLENNTVLGIDVQFYKHLHTSNCGTGYFDPGWQVLRQEPDGSLAVTKDGLILHIERDCHLKFAERSPAVGDFVAIRMPHNLVQNGFYLAVGNAGWDNDTQTVQIYCNLTSEGAIALMGSLTQQLNAIDIPFKFKVLYNPSDYGRYDSGVLSLERGNYPAIRQIIQIIYLENQSHFQHHVPLFAKLLAPGLAIAEVPHRPLEFVSQDSFGMNCCQIVANGLLESWHKGDESPDARMISIRQHFSQLGIEWQRPYLNPNSEDIYTPLD
jgi:HopA1 effector protein family